MICLIYIPSFTAGPKELRAWTIPKMITAQAAGVIHSDFEKGFIKAEVISYKDYIEYKSEFKVKEAEKSKRRKKLHCKRWRYYSLLIQV